jgi:cysteinyl-tRNA synthetase
MPYLRTLAGFRDEVRKLAMQQTPSKDILALCDKLRDVDLPPLGVALDDQEGSYFRLSFRTAWVYDSDHLV